jgi:hypothetical protein
MLHAVFIAILAYLFITANILQFLHISTSNYFIILIVVNLLKTKHPLPIKWTCPGITKVASLTREFKTLHH